MYYSKGCGGGPFYPYCSKGLPIDLIERLLATYKSTARNNPFESQPSKIEQWEDKAVPVYTMLNWITASGWKLHCSSVSGVYGSTGKAFEQYVFTTSSKQKHD